MAQVNGLKNIIVTQSWTCGKCARRWLDCCLVLIVHLYLIICAKAVDPCDHCKQVVLSFKHGLRETERSHFGGGNTAWEEEKIGKYSTSETRFVEVAEHVCKKGIDELKSKDEHRCFTLWEEIEETVENWYIHKQNSDPDLHKWLCIDKLQHCCPNNTFGANCELCPGVEPDRPCFGNGECEGAGSRKGSGKCKCSKGYQGKVCRICQADFYLAFSNDTNVTCSECDSSCKGCTGPSASNCTKCKTGYEMKDSVCEDVDECLSSPCTAEHQKCVNSVGSFKCDCEDGFKMEAAKNQCVPDFSDPSSSKPATYFFGLLSPEQFLRSVAMFGLGIALALIVVRRSLPLFALFVLTLTLVAYIEYGGGADRFFGNISDQSANLEAMLAQSLKHSAKRKKEL